MRSTVHSAVSRSDQPSLGHSFKIQMQLVYSAAILISSHLISSLVPFVSCCFLLLKLTCFALQRHGTNCQPIAIVIHSRGEDMEFALDELVPLFKAHGVTLLVTTADDNDMAWFSACKLQACHCIPLLSAEFVKSSLCESQVKNTFCFVDFSVFFHSNKTNNNSYYTNHLKFHALFAVVCWVSA